MHTRITILLPSTLAILAAVLLGGCTPPPPARSGGDSDITASDITTTDSTATDTAATEPEPEAVGPAEPALMPTDPAAEPAPEAAPETPTREPKPSEEPAGVDQAAEEDEEMENETPDPAPEEAKQPEAEKAEPEAAAKPESQPAEEAAEKAEMPAEEKPAAETPAAPVPADQAKPEAAAPASGDRVVTGDWPCWGGSIERNMINATTPIAIDFVPAETSEEGKKLLWVAKLGSQTYGNPVVSNGKVWVGTNNGGEYRPKHKGDRGCVLCFEEKTGKFLWQLTREKLPQGRVNDWPEQGICSAPFVEGDRMWVVTNRCELMCLDTEGFYDKENDGPYTTEVDAEEQDADIVWSLDMIELMGVFPHNLATSSPVVVGDMVYILTSNGVDEAHLEVPSPRSPSFIAVNKVTGEVVWEDNTPFDTILHGQWSSPAAGIVNGQTQIYMPGGNGWLYALDAKTGEHIWEFDLNPKDAKWELGGRGTRNNIIATPVFFENSVILGMGQDPEHGEGVGHIYRIDATKKGDVSPVTPENQPNPNSAQIWHWGGVDTDGSLTGEKDNECFRRTLSTVAIHDGLVYAPDLSGRIHCLDFATGKRYWEADILAAVWGSPMVADGKMFLGDEDGILSIFAASKELKKIGEIEFPSSIYSTPTIANGVMYVSDRSRLYAIATQ
jgi:outer membrane protein assembly factor BamB